MSTATFIRIRQRLLRWYDRHRRDLPWRRTSDPYAIWIAETMLQQTQVKTALRYYEKFLRAFPNVDALGRAPLERILQAWAGLGYYRRAENLKKAALQLRRHHSGQLPRDYSNLRRLAGVGRYTAGAVLSIAFRQRYPAVDGNVRRVLGRLFALPDEKTLQSTAAALVPRSRPGDFNQALMELGALVCTPKEPSCKQCPLFSCCLARSAQTAMRFLHRRRYRAGKYVTWPLAIVRFRGKILLRRRAAKGLLAPLWELPGAEAARPDRPMATLRAQLAELVCAPWRARAIAEIRHSITHRRIRAPVFLIEYPALAARRLDGKRWRWIAPSALHKHAVSSMTAKAIKCLHQ